MSSFKKQPTMVSTVRYYNVCASNIAIDFLSIFYTCFCSFSHRYLLCYIFFLPSCWLGTFSSFFFLMPVLVAFMSPSHLSMFFYVFLYFLWCAHCLFCACAHCNFSTSTSNPSSLLVLWQQLNLCRIFLLVFGLV